MNFLEKLFALRDIGPKQWLMVLAGIIFIFWVLKRRQMRVSNALIERGFYRIPELTAETVKSLHQCVFLSTAILEVASDIMQGESEDISWTIFNTAYSAGREDKNSIFPHTIACANVAEYSFPSFYLVSRPFFQKTGCLLSENSIVFSNRTGFSRKYIVSAVDQESVKGLFSCRIMSSLEKRKKDFWLYAHGHSFVCCFLDLAGPGRFDKVLDESETLLFTLLP